MRLALSLAGKGGKRVHPNPMVGCVIVKEGEVVGTGHHEYFGGPHAEINALKAAGEAAAGATLYVTLEPCSHEGKTPPCTDAIIRAGVARVVMAVRDPNPKASGRGLEKLGEQSIEVTEGVLSGESRRMNSSYFDRRRKSERKVIVKFAMSADGKIAARTGDSKWISSEQSRRLVHKLRSAADAIIVGARTVDHDNPVLTSHGYGEDPVRVVIDPELRLPVHSHIFDSKAPTIVFHATSGSVGKLANLKRRNILAVRLPQKGGKIRFTDIIATLRRYSLETILIEGGGETIASALEAGVVTDAFIVIAPKIIGGKSAKSPVEGRGVANVRNALRLIDVKVEKVGPDFLLAAKLEHKKLLNRR